MFAPDPESGRVVLLAMDAASLDVISPAVADGRLPNFGRLLDGGASMHLATLRPTQPGPVWTAVATGKLPWRNGVRSAATYRAVTGSAAADLLPDFCFAHALVSFGLLSRDAADIGRATRASRSGRFSDAPACSSTIVRWPLTWPAQPLPGTLVSDEYHRASELALALDEPGLTYPTELASRLARVGRPRGEQRAPARSSRSTTPWARRRWRSIATTSRWPMRSPAESPARFTAVRAAGPRHRRPLLPALCDAAGVWRRLRGRARPLRTRLRRSTTRTSMRSWAALLDRLTPGDLLLVVSPFGLEPLSLPKRLLERTLGNPAISGTHERAPDGFLLAYGAAVKPGRYPRGSVVDVTPTLLYYFGLPIGRDMDGYARTDIFTTRVQRPSGRSRSFRRTSGRTAFGCTAFAAQCACTSTP